MTSEDTAPAEIRRPDGGGADPGGSVPVRPRAAPLRIRPLPGGPLLVEGPAEIVMPDGSVVLCERPLMALCTCRRTLRAPFCDTSHRPRLRHDPRATAAAGAPRAPKPSLEGDPGPEEDTGAEENPGPEGEPAVGTIEEVDPS